MKYCVVNVFNIKRSHDLYRTSEMLYKLEIKGQIKMIPFFLTYLRIIIVTSVYDLKTVTLDRLRVNLNGGGVLCFPFGLVHILKFTLGFETGKYKSRKSVEIRGLKALYITRRYGACTSASWLWN